MAHRALTLKYRPQTFADMIGQEHVSAVIERALETGRIAHAYLFTGARGVGKTTSARLLAKALNCPNRGVGGRAASEPCNECSSCREITTGVSLDVIEIDGASNRGIADVQALREKVRFSPTGGKYRVVIIDEVHQLSNDAFAALLKTLEEPPPHLVFVFATTDPQRLPETIRSRTQRFDFARVPLRKVADRLLDIQRREAQDPEGVRFTLTEGAALLIAHKGEGSMRDAVGGLDQVVSAGESGVDEELVRRVLGIADREAFFAIAGAVLAREPKAALHALHQAFEKGIDARELAEGLSEHIRHILVLKVDPEAGDLVALAREDLERLKQQGASWSDNDLMRLLKLVSEASWPMRDSPQPLLHLEAAVLQMATLEPGETLAEILAKLEALERRLGGAPATGPGGRVPAAGAGSRAAGAAASAARLSAPAAPASTAPASTAPASSPPPPARRPASDALPAPDRGVPRSGGPSGGAPPRAAAAAPASPPAPAAVASPIWPSVTAGVAAPPAATLEVEVERGEEQERQWQDALAGLNQRKRMLGAFLEQTRFVGVTADAVVVAMDDLHRAVIEEKENRALVTAELCRAFGCTLGLRCAREDATEARRRPALEDVKPMVDRALEWFDTEQFPPQGRRTERTDE